MQYRVCNFEYGEINPNSHCKYQRKTVRFFYFSSKKSFAGFCCSIIILTRIFKMLPQANQFWKITGIPLLSLTLLQLLVMPESVAATPKITASASFSKKAQQLMVKGKATGVSPGTYVSFYDASSNKLLYSVKPDAKGTYTANLSDFNSSASSPCNIIAQVGEKKSR